MLDVKHEIRVPQKKSFLERMDKQLVKFLAVSLLALNVVGCHPAPTRLGRVAGSSMGTKAKGEHFLCKCPDCRFEFACDREQAEERLVLVCPNCGFSQIEKSACRTQPAESVKIYLNPESLERWDVVAFQMPDSPDSGIKRVIGLPNESCRIEHGNIFIDDKIARKTLAQQKAIRLQVHDSKYSGERDIWVPKNGSWESDQGEFQFRPNSASHSAKSRLEFRPGRHYSHAPTKADEPTPVQDSYGYNQSLSRDLNSTDELSLEIEFKPLPQGSHQGTFGIEFDSGGTMFDFEMDIQQGELTVLVSGTEVAQHRIALETSKKWQVEFSSIDRQVLLIVNGDVLFEEQLAPIGEGAVSSTPLAIYAAGAEFRIARLLVYRDVHYFGPGGEARFEFALNERQPGYVLLGDNVPLSIDSRHWKTPLVVPGDIIGKVKTNGNR